MSKIENMSEIGTNTIYLTKEITNEDGYVDTIDRQIRSAEKEQPLTMLITCPGGDVYQGARLFRAVLQHHGTTKAVVIGLAASMAGVLLGAFDEVELDEDCEVMFHKAHIPDLKLEDYTDDQTRMCERFNTKAYNKLAKRGVNVDFLDDVFLGDSIEDYWLTAKEAEQMGIGKVTRVERNEGKPSVVRLAAQLTAKQIYEDYKTKKMGLLQFNKPKAVGRQKKLPDGRTVAFVSASDEIKKGDKLILIGDGSLKGKVKISNNMVAEIDENDTVQNVEAIEPSEEQDSGNEAVAALEERVEAIEDAVSKIMEMMGSKEEGEPEAAAEVAKEIEAKLEAKEKEIEDKVTAATALLTNAIKAAETISGKFKPNLPDNKHEQLAISLENSQERAEAMNKVLRTPK